MRRLLAVVLLLCLIPSVGGAGPMSLEASAGDSGFVISQADVEESRTVQGLDESCYGLEPNTCIPKDDRLCLLWPDVWLVDYCKADHTGELCDDVEVP